VGTFDSLLDETLEAWSDVRGGLIDEVENIPEDKFDFRPTPEVRSVAEMVQHILEVAVMMTGELARPDTDFRRAPWPELLDLYASHIKQATDKESLLALLRSSMVASAQRWRGERRSGGREPAPFPRSSGSRGAPAPPR